MFRSSFSLVVLFCLWAFAQAGNNCSSRETCSNTVHSSPLIYDDELLIRSRNCFCDAACDEYGDCCHSVSRPEKPIYECVDFLEPTITSKTMAFDRLSVWMRTECLPIYVGSKIDQQCRNLNKQTFEENPILFVPVTSRQTNVTYQNYYCAYCNNDGRSQMESWELKTFCSSAVMDDSYLTLNTDEQVQYYVYNLTRSCFKTIQYPRERESLQPAVFVRPCKQTLPATCPPSTPLDLARKCSSSTLAYRYVINSSSIYPNAFCAECHGVKSAEITCLDPFVRSAVPPMNHIRMNPLSILFDPNLLKRYLNNDTIPRRIYSRNYTCPTSGQLYDLFANRCVPVSDSTQEFIISMQCTRPMSTTLAAEDKVYPRNGSLYLANVSFLLTRDEYVFISDNSIVFCADRWPREQDLSSDALAFPLYRHILSIICTSISLACLLLFGVVFWLVPSLQNLPGKCLLFLSICLFLGQLTFVIGSNLSTGSPACFAAAILIHYFYLSSFVWLLIISIQIYATFSSQLLPRDSLEKTNHRLIALNILVWCSTGIVILMACLIQFLRPQSSFSPAYGSLACSISQANAMIVFFLVPIGCLLLLVGVLFVKTLWSIHRSRSIAKVASITASSSSSAHHQRMAFVYARLASLMGVQWILLIGALAIGQSWSWVIFEVINSLPGVFICLGFLCSKRLVDSLRQRITSKIVTRRQSSRSNITSSTTMSPSLPPIKAREENFTFNIAIYSLLLMRQSSISKTRSSVFCSLNISNQKNNGSPCLSTKNPSLDEKSNSASR